MNRAIRIVLILCIAISFLLFLRSTDINESLRLIKRLDYSICSILLTTFLAYYFGALGWKYCINAKQKPSMVDLFALRHIGNVITVFNPSGAIAGEMFNANMLIARGISKEVAYQSVFLSRIMMVISQITLLVIVIVWFLFFHSEKLPTPIKYTFYGCMAIFFVILLSLCWWLLKKDSRQHNASIEKKWQKGISQIRKIRLSLTEYILAHPKDAIFAYLLFTLHWVLGSLELYFILNGLGFPIGFWDGLFLDTLIIVSKSAVAFIPGQIGAEELINKFALFLIKINSATLWLSVSILRRARQLFWSGIAFLFYLGLKHVRKAADS